MPHDQGSDKPVNLKDLCFTPEDYHSIRRYLCTPSPCVLCGAKNAPYHGLFATRHGVPTRGMLRLVGYGLCQPCSALPHVAARLEAHLKAMYAAPCN